VIVIPIAVEILFVIFNGFWKSLLLFYSLFVKIHQETIHDFKNNIRFMIKKTAFFVGSFVAFFLCLSLQSKAQSPSYELYITNQQQISRKIYQFDVYLLRIGSTPLELASMQFGIGFDTSIANGGTLSFSMVSGSSQLVASQVPVAFSLGTTTQTETIGGVVYRYLNQAARSGPGSGNGTVISAVKTSCSSPGTRIGTYRLTNTADFKTASTPKHIFSSAIGNGKTSTLVAAYVGGVNTTITGTNMDYTTAGTCDQNLSFNPATLNVNVRALLEGPYIGAGQMTPTLYNLGMSTNPTTTDTVEINLWNPSALSASAPNYSTKAILHTDGTATFSLPNTELGNSYFISIKHRNSIETWSSASVSIVHPTNYDFTTSLSKAYSDGVNPAMKNMGGGVFAIYGGDVNQDGTVDGSDMNEIDNNTSVASYGYDNSDANGDGASDGLDMNVVDNNTQLGLFFARPY